VKRAADSVASLEHAEGWAIDLDMPSLRVRLNELMAVLKSGAEIVATVLHPSQVGSFMFGTDSASNSNHS
jgi:hypothetical protein